MKSLVMSVLCAECVKMSAGKSVTVLSQSMSRVDKHPVSAQSWSSLAVSSSRLRQRHFKKSSRKRPAEVFLVTSCVPGRHENGLVE